MYGLYISAEGAMAQTTRLETLSNNLANANTSGFKRELAVLQARYSEETESGRDYAGSHSLNDLGGGVKISGTKLEMGQGPLKKSGIDTDLAIQGDGYFVVQRGNDRLLTRSGNFGLTSTGQLVTQEGYPVLSEDNEQMIVDPTGGPWRISPEGALMQNGNSINIGLVRTDSPGDLVRVGDNFFSPLVDPRPTPLDERKVLPGFIEQSAVRPTLEMMELIEATRAIEANVNMVRNHDQMLGALVERVIKS
jgi:flagellar basal body rod protein FlgG